MWIFTKGLVVALKKCSPERVIKMRKWPKTESEDLGFVLKYCLAKNAAHMQKQNYWLVYPKSQQVMAIAKTWMESFFVDTQTKNCQHTRHI